MKRMIFVALLALLLLTAVVLAEPTNFTLPWWTVDGGGGTSSSSGYSLSGTIGQFDAHTASTGGNYAVRGGFWQPGAVSSEQVVFLPIVMGQ